VTVDGADVTGTLLVGGNDALNLRRRQLSRPVEAIVHRPQTHLVELTVSRVAPLGRAGDQQADQLAELGVHDGHQTRTEAAEDQWAPVEGSDNVCPSARSDYSAGPR
jgi:hypothetical protein